LKFGGFLRENGFELISTPNNLEPGKFNPVGEKVAKISKT
jgi:hypothetical protein